MHLSAPSKGFTLVELLVIVSIISVLSVIGITIFGNITSSARDAKRKADLQILSDALELYFNKNNYYPVANFTGQAPNGPVEFSGSNDSVNPWIPDLAPHLAQFPTDPINNASSQGGTFGGVAYYYLTGGTDCDRPSAYTLIAFLENSPPNLNTNFQSCTGTVVNFTNIFIRQSRQ
jgi:prepilin-type N-terminal cleavage/methylation domain-containing protein